MVHLGKILAAVGAVVLFGTATLAHAESNSPTTTPPLKTNEFSNSADGAHPWTIPYPHKTYTFDNKGRWGVRLDLTQPTNREPEWKDADVGAYFRVNPRFRVSGAVGLGDKFAQPQHITPQDTAPRVHLGGAFKF